MNVNICKMTSKSYVSISRVFKKMLIVDDVHINVLQIKKLPFLDGKS